MIRFLRVDCDGEHSERDAAYLEVPIDPRGDLQDQLRTQLDEMDWTIEGAEEGKPDRHWCPECAALREEAGE